MGYMLYYWKDLLSGPFYSNSLLPKDLLQTVTVWIRSLGNRGLL